MTSVTIPKLQQMKRDGEKIVGVVVWDYQMARIVDRTNIEIMSVGDTVGFNLWGQANPARSHNGSNGDRSPGRSARDRACARKL